MTGCGECSIEFRAVGAGQSCDVPRKLDRGALHAQTQAEEWNLVFPRILDRGDFPFDPARAESAGNQNPIGLAQDPLGPLPFDLLGFDPADVDLVS